MQRMFVLKDKLNCTMKKCMVTMATVYAILEHGCVHTKLTISPLLLILDQVQWSRISNSGDMVNFV